MKTITVSDEMYDFLLETGRNILTQDNRCTASPIFFTIQERMEEARPEDCGDYKIIDPDGNDVDIFSAITEDIADNEAEFVEKYLAPCSDVDELNKVLSDKDYENINNLQLTLNFEEYLNDHALTEVCYEVVHRNTEQNGGAFFLTEQACIEHLARNGHNYKEPRSYVGHAYRNREIEDLCRFLKGIAQSHIEVAEPDPTPMIRSFDSFLNPNEIHQEAIPWNTKP